MAMNLCRSAIRGLKTGGAFCNSSRFIRPQSVVQMQVRTRMRETPITALFGYKFMHKFDEKSRIYVVDGNLAVGKTTLAKTLAELTGLKYVPEANVFYIDEKELGPGKHYDPKFSGGVSLDRFYEDPHATDGHSFRFQYMMYINRLRQYADVLEELLETGQGVIMERSVYSDFVFMEAIIEMGWARKQCQTFYNTLRELSLPRLRHPHCVIYLDAPSEVLHQRFTERGKGAQKEIPLEYFQHLDNCYITRFLPSMSEAGVEILHYDWTNFGDPDKIISDMEKLKFEDSDWNRDDNISLDILYRFVSDKYQVVNTINVPQLLPEITLSAHQYEKLLGEFQDDLHRHYMPGYNQTERSFWDVFLKG